MKVDAKPKTSMDWPLLAPGEYEQSYILSYKDAKYEWSWLYSLGQV